ncbi:MAG: hypothetical protein GOVbin5978_16 [Prokaryotic dsDNA virus sp.]|nr:MAG: hypothetical protein GOVbin5978_16 [Prokaryotic dsDNA virus sp.]|tara:strand:- start:525 stop:914 length:390 start_codon:yes stop_codon:yes gene_type:complete
MGILGKIFSKGAKGLVDSVGSIIDEVHTSDEEKQQMKLKIQEMITSHEAKIQEQVTRRWEADMKGNWLTKSIRPLSLAFLLLALTTFTLVDFGFVDLDIKDSWIELWKMLAITAFGAYFGGRSYEKMKK